MYNTEEKIKGRQWVVPGVHKKLGNFFILDLQCDATHLLGLAERRPNVIDQKMVNKKVYYYISAQIVTPSWAHCSALKSNGWPRSYGLKTLI